MAKVFATYLKNGEVVLETWSSAKAFQETESWTDDKFILITTSDDFKGKASFPLSPMFDEKIEVSTSQPEGNGFNIIQTEDEIKAHNLLVDARNKYLGIK